MININEKEDNELIINKEDFNLNNNLNNEELEYDSDLDNNLDNDLYNIETDKTESKSIIKKQNERNYTKKESDKLYKNTLKEYKTNTTQRDRILRKLETCNLYDDLREDILLGKIEIPKGVKLVHVEDVNLLKLANEEVEGVVKGLHDRISNSEKLTNFRFYINQPYFDRNGGGDPFPLYKWNDKRVKNICSVVENALKLYNKEFSESLNVIVRIYRPGDILNFHTDRDDFSESVFGCILKNLDESRGLILTSKKKKPFMLPEKDGMCWEITGESRWDWEHGYCTQFKSKMEIVRVCITFRFFNEKKAIPKKNYEDFM